MATGPGVNQGKTAFVEEFLAGNSDGNLEDVKKAWTAAGNEGTVSESLVNKVRARLGRTGKKAVGEPRPVEAPRKAKSRVAAKVRKIARPIDEAPLANGSPASSGASRHGDADILDNLEEDIDELIHKIRELGGRPDVVKALRRARRLLVRSHEG